ncbi:hypothetical protein [Nocardioides marmorisolisilvae]|uniref:WD40 repeat domain-containing protein n=1 Tax=Nocardioides marmorisolisilvae TaxID=1542737 RepID=A0A3N0DZH7_9ACTN|nr:hypothetical protein [Nocardioides marmorisolisilvae]RNL80961.1 hypothetical protein EFL95_00825 [Nocardioides marmorisolisilvae]
MNGPMNDDLTNTLNKRADDFARLGGHDLDLAQVVSRAGEIRRGRRMRASIVMAAVTVAIAVPVGVTVLGQNDTSRKPEPTPTTQAPADHSKIIMADLTPGAKPKLGVVLKGSVETQDGTVTLPSIYGDELATPQLVSAYATRDGYMLVSSDDSGNNTVRYWSQTDTTQTKTWPIDGNVVVSAEGNVAAFTQPDGTVTVVQDDGSLYFDLGKIPDPGAFTAVGVSGENCSGRSDLEDSCEVLVGTQGQIQQTWQIDAHGKTSQVYPDFQRVSDISADGDVAGIVSYTDSGACSEVETKDGAKLWESCTYRIISFSPGGEYVLAANVENDGLGDKDLTILNAKTGDVVLHLETVASSYIPQMIWEDASHVLAVVSDELSQSVQRIALNGNRTNAFPITPNPENGYAFHLVQP